MSASLIREWCELFSVPFRPLITPALERRLALHADLLDTGLDSYSFGVLVATEIDALPDAEWSAAMQSVVVAFERETRIRGYLLKKGNIQTWLN
ncbi:MAG TPA: hypothetical protein VJN69_14440 [Candidatus Acidoferrales bacterium]|nr:hypothetical protein [Candidatus Acidoferrales bacterium]